jgi:hypothetical protein
MASQEEINREMEELVSKIHEFLDSSQSLSGLTIENLKLTGLVTDRFGRVCFDSNNDPYWYPGDGPCPIC